MSHTSHLTLTPHLSSPPLTPFTSPSRPPPIWPHTASNDTGRFKHTRQSAKPIPENMKKQSDKNMQIGMEWSNVTLSCAYDCLFTILRNVYNHNNQQWNERVNEAN